MSTAAAAVSGSSASRPAPNLLHALGGVWRLTWRRMFAPGQWRGILGGTALLTVLAFLIVRTGVARGHYWQYYDFVVKVFLAIIVPVMAFLSGAAAVRDDLRPTTVDYIFTRPVPRWAYMVFRYVAHLAGAQVIYGISLAALLMLGSALDVPGLWSAGPRLWLGLALALTAFVALGFCFGAATTRYLVLGIFYGGIVEIGIGNIRTALSRLSMTQQIQGLLAPLNSGSDFAWAGATSAPGATGAVLLFSGVALALTIALMAFREFSGDRAKDA